MAMVINLNEQVPFAIIRNKIMTITNAIIQCYSPPFSPSLYVSLHPPSLSVFY